MDERGLVRIQIGPHIDPIGPVPRHLDQRGDQTTILTYIGQGNLTEFQSVGGIFESCGRE